MSSASGFVTRAPQRPPEPPARPATPRAAPPPHDPHHTRVRAALQLLVDLPVWTSASPLPPHALHVRGRAGTPATRLDLTLADLTVVQAFTRELPGHLAAPPVYRLTLPERHNIEFVCGYQTARRTCLPPGGVFCPAGELGAATLTCPYPVGSGEARAFRDGARTYLQFVLAFEEHDTPPSRGGRSGKESA